MSTMTTSNSNSTKPHRAGVSLKLPTKVPALITYAQGIVTGMTNNPSFPSPMPALSTVQAAITDLQTAETAALARAKGAVATRNEKRAALIALLQSLRTDVQNVADANAPTAPSIIQGAGMAVRKTPARAPRVFAVTPGSVSGSVKIVAAAAAHRAGYEWQYSTDGGKTWTLMPVTLQAKTSLAGLPVGTTVEVRYRPVTKTGEADWSAPVSMTVQ